MIKANTCPHCGGPYTLDAGGCLAQCPDDVTRNNLTRQAADGDPGETGEPSPDACRLAVILVSRNSADAFAFMQRARELGYTYDSTMSYLESLAAELGQEFDGPAWDELVREGER